jgi:hypothetical protein
VKLGGTLFLTYSHRRNLFLPGLTIRLIKAEFSKQGTNPFLETLYISGYERTLLENLQPSRQRGKITIKQSKCYMLVMLLLNTMREFI